MMSQQDAKQMVMTLVAAKARELIQKVHDHGLSIASMDEEYPAEGGHWEVMLTYQRKSHAIRITGHYERSEQDEEQPVVPFPFMLLGGPPPNGEDSFEYSVPGDWVPAAPMED